MIEIGVDMPNVNTLFVLHAERFGISTLHQLRGRVGRSDRQAYAYFLTGKENLQPQSVDRLQSLRVSFSLFPNIFRICLTAIYIRNLLPWGQATSWPEEI